MASARSEDLAWPRKSSREDAGESKTGRQLAGLSDLDRELITGLKTLFDPDDLMAAGRILPRRA